MVNKDDDEDNVMIKKCIPDNCCPMSFQVMDKTGQHRLYLDPMISYQRKITKESNAHLFAVIAKLR